MEYSEDKLRAFGLLDDEPESPTVPDLGNVKESKLPTQTAPVTPPAADPVVAREQQQVIEHMDSEDADAFTPRVPSKGIIGSVVDVGASFGRSAIDGAAGLLDFGTFIPRKIAQQFMPEDYQGPEDYQDLFDDMLGKSEDYQYNAATEIAGDIGGAIPLLATGAAGMARYGASTIAKYGTVHPMVASYTLRFKQAMGIDVLAVGVGEVVEEGVEAYGAEEDGILATSANIAASILTGWRVGQKYIDEGIEEVADAAGAIIGKAPKDVNTTGNKVAEAAVQTLNKATKPLETAYGALKSSPGAAIRGTVNAGATLFDKLPMSKWLLSDFYNDGGSVRKLVEDMRHLDRHTKGYFREVMQRHGEEVSDRYRNNLELAASMDLRLDSYQLTGLPEFRGYSLSVARADKARYLRDMDHNLTVLESFLDGKNLGRHPATDEAIAEAFKRHGADEVEAISELKRSLYKQRAEFVESLAEPADTIGSQFKEAFKSFDARMKKLVGAGYDRVLSEGKPVSGPFIAQIASDALAGSDEVVKNVVLDSLETTTTKNIITGLEEASTISAQALHDARSQLLKAQRRMTKTGDLYDAKNNAYNKLISALEQGMVQSLGPKKADEYHRLNYEYRTIIADKRRGTDVKSFTLKDTMGNIKANGQALMNQLFRQTDDKESVAKAVGELLEISSKDLAKMSYRLGNGEEALALDNVKEAKELMDFKLKAYISNRFMNKVLQTPDKDVYEVADAFTQIHGKQIEAALGQAPDLTLISREVANADAAIKKKFTEHMHDTMKINVDSKGNFDVGSYVNGTLLKNPRELAKLAKFLEDGDKLKSLGITADEIRDGFASNLVGKYISKDKHGFIEDSELYKLINERRDDVVKMLGETRTQHLESFQNGFDMVTMFNKGDIREELPDLERKMFSGLLQYVPSVVSQQFAVLRNAVSTRHVVLLNTTRMLGGIKSSSYQKYVTKMMTDPAFFQEQVTMAKNVKTHDDLVRMRLYVLHNYGIDTAVLSKEDAEEAQVNFIRASDTVETSPHSELGFSDAADFYDLVDEVDRDE